MAEIDHRVRILINALMDRGFGWLAAEVIEIIERGRPGPIDHDSEVRAQRNALNRNLARGLTSSISRPDELRDRATHSAQAREPFTADEQVSEAVHLIVERILSTTKMISTSASTLGSIMDGPVSLFTEINGEIRLIDADQATQVALSLRQMNEELIAWLLSRTTTEDT
jgi:hypothetical protein